MSEEPLVIVGEAIKGQAIYYACLCLQCLLMYVPAGVALVFTTLHFFPGVGLGTTVS